MKLGRECARKWQGQAITIRPHNIERCRPDLLMVEKVSNTATIIDVAVPGEIAIVDREQEKNLSLSGP